MPDGQDQCRYAGVCGRGIGDARHYNQSCPKLQPVMPDLIGHLNIGPHQRRFLGIYVEIYR